MPSEPKALFGWVTFPIKFKLRWKRETLIQFERVEKTGKWKSITQTKNWILMIVRCNVDSFILLLFHFQLRPSLKRALRAEANYEQDRYSQAITLTFDSQSTPLKKQFPQQIYRFYLSDKKWEEEVEKNKRLDAKLLQSIENKFNFNSCLWINVSNHRVNVHRIYETISVYALRLKQCEMFYFQSPLAWKLQQP